MTAGEFASEMKDYLETEMGGIEEVKKSKKGLFVKMDDGKCFMLKVERLDSDDDEDEDEEDDEEDEDEDLYDEDEDDEDDEDDEEE